MSYLQIIIVTYLQNLAPNTDDQTDFIPNNLLILKKKIYELLFYSRATSCLNFFGKSLNYVNEPNSSVWGYNTT